MSSSTSLSEYEVVRARNIERNNARLRQLGLISKQEEIESNAAAWKKELPQQQRHDEDDQSRKRKRKNNVKPKKALPPPPSSPSRKSLRLQGLQPDNNGESVEEGDEEPLSSSTTIIITEEERQQRVQECREARLRIAKEYADLGVEKAGRDNPTATYEHCAMRVRTMKPKALANRVKAIERAAGKHCVIKMAIFKSCLQDKGMWDLSDQASQALERLKALQPPPVNEEEK